MSSAGDFAKMVPGFDFLQGLMKNAGSALPSMGQWIAPTLDPEELDKRIGELRTVQFWLEQNARMLAATIQALEVQRMTLSTLKTMNLPVAEMAEAFKIKTPPAAEPAPRPAQEREPEAASAAPERPAGIVDPMQWWGALTKQFTELAAKTLQDSSGDATNLAGAMVKQSMDAAGQAMKAAAPAPAKAAAKSAKAAKPATSTGRAGAAKSRRAKPAR